MSFRPGSIHRGASGDILNLVPPCLVLSTKTRVDRDLLFPSPSRYKCLRVRERSGVVILERRGPLPRSTFTILLFRGGAPSWVVCIPPPGTVGEVLMGNCRRFDYVIYFL